MVNVNYFYGHFLCRYVTNDLFGYPPVANRRWVILKPPKSSGPWGEAASCGFLFRLVMGMIFQDSGKPWESFSLDTVWFCLKPRWFQSFCDHRFIIGEREWFLVDKWNVVANSRRIPRVSELGIGRWRLHFGPGRLDKSWNCKRLDVALWQMTRGQTRHVVYICHVPCPLVEHI